MIKLETDWASMNEQVNAITEEAKVLNKEQQEIGSDLRKIKNSYRDKQVG